MSEYNPERISKYLHSRIESFTLKEISYETGTVISAIDGVVKISGLGGCRYCELLRFESGVVGMAMELSVDGVSAVLFDQADKVHVGEWVRGTNRISEIPVGNELLGRVVDSIGRPLDGTPLNADEFLPCEQNAPSIIDRKPVCKPLETGILAVDSMIPIGKGQRELIIGDRKTGKTAIAVDTVLNQKGKDVICVYCAIGQKADDVAYIYETFRRNGCLDYCVTVSASASDSPAMQYLAPYAACSIAEYFMKKGKDTLVIYDDLSKHAVAYRTVSLLLHRPPGREAYPGDVFYLHSRLLERAAALSDENGGGTMTALPIVETTGNNIAAYIPTNVISITDGQIYLESELFASGIRPAINTGLSVSRVGRAAQFDAMKKVSGGLRLKLAQYREMEVFARFGSDVDEATRKILNSGKQLTELFKQQKSSPLSLSDEVCLLAAFNSGVFSETKPENIRFKAQKLLEYMNENYRIYMEKINSAGDLDDGFKDDFIKAILSYEKS